MRDTTLIRLLQLVSPTLPIGGFTYSQGMEWAVEAGWLRSETDTLAWLDGLIDDTLVHLEIPLLARLYGAWQHADHSALTSWSDYLLAARETRELRQEESNRARALATLLCDLDLAGARAHRALLQTTQTTGFTCAAVAWGIALEATAQGYAWSWLENQVAAAIKLVPLGQTAGQRLLLKLGARLPEAAARGLALEDDEIGASAPALAIASARHETQYTRLFRS